MTHPRGHFDACNCIAREYKLEAGKLPLPTEENPSINLDQHEGEANDYAKQEYKIIKILNHHTLDYTTQYLV